MDYKVQFVADDELPEPHEWLIAKEGECVTVYILRSALSEEVLEAAWAGYRHAVAEGVAPRLRALSLVS